MVLNDLGKNLNSAFNKLFKSNRVDKSILDEVLKDISRALLEADVNVRLVQKLLNNVRQIIDFENLPPGANKQRIIHKAVVDELAKLVDPESPPFRPKKGQTNVIMFVGLQGSGKTTSCSKLAYHYSKKGWKTALVCADTFRAGAFDQLRQNAIKAKIPYFGSYSEKNPVKLVQEGVAMFREGSFEIIIVDTSGRHRQEAGLLEEMREMAAIAKPECVIMVVDGSIGQAAEAHAKSFMQAVSLGGILLTKMDGHAKGGGAISSVASTKAPILFIGTGEHMADLEPFAVRPFIQKMLGMGDIVGLMNRVQEEMINRKAADGKSLEHQQLEMLSRLEKGKFTLADLGEQLRMIQSLGPLKNIAQMLPGMSGGGPLAGLLEGTGEQGERDATNNIKKFIIIMDSMTKYELHHEEVNKLFQQQPTRVDRIAQGSGTTRRDVEILVSQYKKFSQMMKKMGGGLGGLGGGGGPGGLLRGLYGMDPSGNHGGNAIQSQRMQQQMASRMGVSPDLLRQMGDGFQDAMRQLNLGSNLSLPLGNNNPSSNSNSTTIRKKKR